MSGRDGRRAAEGTPRPLLAMALASGITSVPNAAIVPALPTIHRHFDASLTELEWTVTGYLLAYSGLLIAAGRLADVFGRVRLLTRGTLLYMLASIPAARAGSATVLIWRRGRSDPAGLAATHNVRACEARASPASPPEQVPVTSPCG